MPLAAGLILCLSLSILTYRMGKNRRTDVVRGEQKRVTVPLAVPSESLEAVRDEFASMNTQLAERDRAIAQLRREITQKKSENVKLLAYRSEQLLAAASTDEAKKQFTEDRDRIAQQAATNQQALEAAERKLKALEIERSSDAIHASILEAKVTELAHTLSDRERKLQEDEDLLAKDRDIRELMGARDLYIAEVHDVLTTGDTRKAFGRVFYTKGKSLIFYAYDLTDLPGLKAASTFQAWGNRGPDRRQALKLGMFYEDNVSKKRWVMKFNDRKALEQIDAVFVTIEPPGGSNKPSGMPLMYAYLKVNANHP